MAYKCAICKRTYVDHEGDVCDACLSKATGSSLAYNQDNNEKKNDGLPRIIVDDKPIKKPKKEKVVKDDTTTIEGIVRNYREFEVKNSLIERIFKSMFTFTPFMADTTVQTFQVYSSIDNQSISNEKVCDEVIVYGRILGGSVYDNNFVSVKGRRNKNNTLEAKTIFNKTSNSELKLHHALHPIVLWAILVGLVAGIYFLFFKDGGAPIKWSQISTVVVIAAIAILTVIALIKTHPFICIGILLILAFIFVFPSFIKAQATTIVLFVIVMIIIFKSIFK